MVLSVVKGSTLTTFFVGLSPVLCLILFAQSIYMFRLSYKTLAITLMILSLVLGILFGVGKCFIYQFDVGRSKNIQSINLVLLLIALY